MNVVKATVGRIVAAGRWLIQHEPVLTGTVAVAVANAVYAGLNDGLHRDQLIRSAAVAALGVLIRAKVGSPATLSAFHDVQDANDALVAWQAERLRQLEHAIPAGELPPPISDKRTYPAGTRPPGIYLTPDPNEGRR